MIIATSKVKKNILDLYAIKCEQQPNSKYFVLREETLTEVIAESEDVRQSLLPLE